MFGSASGHLRIRLHQFEVTEPRSAVVFRELWTSVRALPCRCFLHALVLSVALLVAAASIRGVT